MLPADAERMPVSDRQHQRADRIGPSFANQTDREVAPANRQESRVLRDIR